MKEYSEDEIRSIWEEFKKLDEEFIKRKELLKIIKELHFLLYKEIAYIREQFSDLERTMLEMKRELDERINKIEKRLAELTQEETIEFRILPKEKAMKLIKEYIEKNPGCLTSEIIESLQLDPSLVVEILGELEKSGEVESRESE